MDINEAIKHLEHPEPRGVLTRMEVMALDTLIDVAKRWHDQTEPPKHLDGR